LESEQASRLGIALAISIGIHLFVVVVSEVSSKDSQPKVAKAPPVEITRIAMDGSTLPSGRGNSSFNSPAATASSGFGQKYDVDAGVPTKIKIPTDQRPIAQPSVTQPTAPVQNPVQQSQPQAQPQQQTPTRNPNEFYPPVNQGVDSGQGQAPSMPSRPSTAGNQGQKRSRGPNRVAFPEYTVEPTVSINLIGSGVTNSVDLSVEIAADGSHTEQIVRSSGSSEVDSLVLAALKQWRWDPAARDGQAIASTQNFKFTFKPR
jgi:periplasmic protein TonB